MIQVTLYRSGTDRSIRGFAVEGHAGYAARGSDIVCAGVSAITVGTVNALEERLGVVLPHKMKHGYLEASVPELDDRGTAERVQLILESMRVMLRTIEQSYGRYLAVCEEYDTRS
jgi:hypothetical protein